MDYVQPIRDKNQIEKMKSELMKSNYRDYMLFVLGINTGLRISDLLKLKVIQTKDSHISFDEQKTGKYKRIKVTQVLRDELDKYTANMRNSEYLFKSQKGDRPIDRTQAYRILNAAAKVCGITEIGTHTLRKTFGYHFYQKTQDIAMLQQLFNHSAPSVTLRYIGITQDMIDNALEDFEL